MAKINTIQDMIDCTNENNLEDFLTDLRGYLSAAHSIRGIVGEFEDLKEFGIDGFIWIEDGKHDVKVEIKGD